MKKNLTLLIAIIAIAVATHAQNTWTQKADFSGNGRGGAVGFSIGDKGYIGTGSNSQTWYKDFWEYDPDIDAWTQKADVGPNARRWAVGFSIGNKGYIGTGQGDGHVAKDFWEYDPVTNVWKPKSNFGGTARRLAVGFSIGDKGYIATGINDQCCIILTNDLWEYDPSSDSWTKKADFPGTKRLDAIGLSIGNKGYVGLGIDCEYCGGTDDFWEYVPATDSWLQRADFPGGARADAMAFSIGDKGYVGTGSYQDYDSSIIYGDFWEFDPASNTWTQRADFGGGARSDAVGFSIGNQGYAGISYSLNDIWEYTPEVSCASPEATITPLGDLDICNTGFVKLQASSGIGYTYQWNRNNVDLVGQVYQTLKAKKTGNYRVRISTSDGCSAVSKKANVYSSCKLGEDSALISSLSLYPNPTSGTFTLDLQHDDEETSQAEVQVLNMLGQTIPIDKGQWTVDNGRLMKEIQLSDVADGMYLVKVTVGDKIFTAQIDLQK